MKYDKEHIDIIIDSLGRGIGRIQTCKQAGIDYQTFLNWLSDPLKIDFFEAVKNAEMSGRQYEKESLEQIIKRCAADKNKPVWQAAAWLLERKYPKEYSTRQTIDMNTTEAIRENVSAMFPTEEELDALMKDAKNSK
jgi:hypothetical protein